jgi:hypothetical protein
MPSVDNNGSFFNPDSNPSNSLVRRQSNGNLGRAMEDLSGNLREREEDATRVAQDVLSKRDPSLNDMITAQKTVNQMTRTAEFASAIIAAFHNALLSIIKNIR